MTKKAYKVKFYMPHDIDLISLMLTHEVNLTKAMYCSLKAFCKGEVFVIKIPEMREVSLPKHKVYSRNLKLDVVQDKEMIDVMEKIALGYRTNFLKNLLRLYLLHPLTEDFLQSKEDIQEFDKRFDIFAKDLKVADAASIHKSYTKKKQVQKKYSEEQTELLPHGKPDKFISEHVAESTLEGSEEQELADEQELTDLFASLFM